MKIEPHNITLAVNTDESEYPETLKGFARVLEEAAMIMIEKVNLYGDSRYHLKSFDYDSKMLFSDLYRKFIRIENITWKFNELVESGMSRADLISDLREAYMDALNYCVMGVQLLDDFLIEAVEEENDE